MELIAAGQHKTLLSLPTTTVASALTRVRHRRTATATITPTDSPTFFRWQLLETAGPDARIVVSGFIKLTEQDGATEVWVNGGMRGPKEMIPPNTLSGRAAKRGYEVFTSGICRAIALDIELAVNREGPGLAA